MFKFYVSVVLTIIMVQIIDIAHMLDKVIP
jgi:hypothetical protein